MNEHHVIKEKEDMAEMTIKIDATDVREALSEFLAEFDKRLAKAGVGVVVDGDEVKDEDEKETPPKKKPAAKKPAAKKPAAKKKEEPEGPEHDEAAVKGKLKELATAKDRPAALAVLNKYASSMAELEESDYDAVYADAQAAIDGDGEDEDF